LELTLKFLNLSKTPLGTWDALTPLEAVDYTSPPEDVSTQDKRPKTPSKAADKTPWPKLRIFFQNPPMNYFKGGRLRLQLELKANSKNFQPC
jgi:hypothetical protein